MSTNGLILGTRGSALALWQAHFVAEKLERAGQVVEIQEIKTKGDRILNVPLAEIGDKGLFTRELDIALFEGKIDLAVHSLKDLPTRLPEGIVLAAVTQREEPWDVFIAHPSFDGLLEDLPPGAVIATSSLRRQAQLCAWRPDISVVSVRGNVETRLAKLDAGAWQGMILAAAGLKRLNLQHRIRQRIPFSIMIPAVSQGALGIVCSENNRSTFGILARTLDDEETHLVVRCERAFMRRLEGGCQVPVGAYARIGQNQIILEGCVASIDGSVLLRGIRNGSVENSELIGKELAEELLDRGASEILSQIRSGTKHS